MKIVYCLNSIVPDRGDDIAILTKANALSRFNDCQIFIVVVQDSQGARALLSPNVHLVDLGIDLRSLNRHFPANLPPLIRISQQQKKALKSVLNKIRPDVVVSIGGFEKSFLYHLHGSWKLVFEIHSLPDAQLRSARSFLEKSIAKLGIWLNYRYRIKNYDRVVVLTEEEKKRNWPNNPRVCVIPNPLRFDPPSVLPQKEKRIISAGRLAPSKNYSSLIRAFGLIASRFPDWTLDIFGQGAEEPRLLKEIEDLGLTRRVSLKGYCSNLQEEMANSSVFVLSSLWESFGMVITEAMCCGLPAVVYDCPNGPRSIITDGVDGYLVPLGDENAFSKCLSRLLDDDSLRKQMGENAFNASKQYDLSVISSRWMALFKELAGER